MTPVTYKVPEIASRRSASGGKTRVKSDQMKKHELPMITE